MIRYTSLDMSFRVVLAWSAPTGRGEGLLELGNQEHQDNIGVDTSFRVILARSVPTGRGEGLMQLGSLGRQDNNPPEVGNLRTLFEHCH